MKFMRWGRGRGALSSELRMPPPHEIVGFEPTLHDIKNRCLTAWPYLSRDNEVDAPTAMKYGVKHPSYVREAQLCSLLRGCVSWGGEPGGSPAKQKRPREQGRHGWKWRPSPFHWSELHRGGAWPRPRRPPQMSLASQNPGLGFQLEFSTLK